jgi:MFS family permease
VSAFPAPTPRPPRDVTYVQAASSSRWRRGAFWLLAVVLAFFLAAAGAPSPLYPLYQAEWGFSTITLTAIYAVYAFGALAALLVTGRLSDHIGRRWVAILGLLIELGAMLAFVAAQGVADLFVARILQGIGTGVATGSISAWLLDLQPPANPRLGGLVGGVALLAGLGLGALAASLLVQVAPDPLHLTFWLLMGAFAVALLAMPRLPDVVPRARGWLGSLRPVVGVPPAARPAFVVSTPSLVAAWAVAGLYLALGPSLAISLLHATTHVAGGAVIAALLGAAAIASIVLRASDPRALVIRGSVILTVGVGITLAAVGLDSLPGLYVGSVIAGVGLGSVFSGVLRSVTPLAPPNRRGALLAAIYIVVYLSFSLPTIAAGVAVSLYGLREAAYGYGLLVMALAAVTAVLASRRTATQQATPA